MKLQRVSSDDRRTPFREQAVEQSSEMRSALDFFVTAQSCCEHSLESFIRVADFRLSGFPGFLDFSSSEKFKTSPLVPIRAERSSNGS